ncbi:MAG: hypothetical protein M9894_02690 [Planctomycetes bacterium]|nr:hypothetical protein [Planctomycetota bacterium]
MSDLACDRCGRSLLVFEDVRYEVVIRVTAAYDPMELDLDDIARADVSAELERLAAAVGKKTAQELEDEVWKELRFDLCGRCQREFLKDPLPRRTEPD